MKKILFSVIALFAVTTISKADGLVVADAAIQPGKTATVQVSLNSTGESYRAVLFTLSLPAGITVVTDEFGDPVTEADSRIVAAGYSVTANHLGDGSDRFAVMNTSGNTVIPSECGLLFSFTIEADANVVVGSNLTATLSEIKLTDAYAVDHQIGDVTFGIVVEELRTLLSETSTAAPGAATGVDVRVKRTIAANEWSTICLPFAMTEEQVAAAFGSGVELGDFNGYEVKDDGNTINVKFNTATAIEANHPYIIKVGSAVTEFTVDGVDIDPQEAEINLGTSRRPKAIIGNYVAGTAIPNGCLFLNNSQFWYSVGTTKIKAFRAYFDFNDLLPDFEDNYAEARVFIIFDSETTGIADVDKRGVSADSRYFDLQGRRVGQPGKGLYIVDGKKKMIK